MPALANATRPAAPTVGESPESHRKQLARLVSDLRVQLAPPPLTDRPGVDDERLDDFLSRSGDLASGLWYWGPDVSRPAMRCELTAEWPAFREHTAQSEFWNKLETYRRDLQALVEARNRLVVAIRSAVSRFVSLPVAEGSQTCDHITADFVDTIYQFTTRDAGAGWDGSYRVGIERRGPVCRVRWGNTQGVVLASIDSGAAHAAERIANVHQAITQSLSDQGSGARLAADYRALSMKTPQLRKQLEASQFSSLIMGTTCGRCGG
jgi:hypothetical protein